MTNTKTPGPAPTEQSYRMLLAALLAGYALLQIILIPTLPLTYNEGLTLQVSQLVIRGYQPYSQIFTLSSPLFVWFGDRLANVGLSSTGFKLVFLLFGLLLLANTAGITRALLGKRTALAAVFLLATAATFLAQAATALVAITPALSLATLSLVFVLRYTTGKKLRWAFAGGMVWGAAFFLSPAVVSTGLTAIVFLIAFYNGVNQPLHLKWQLLLKPAALWLLGVAIIMGFGLSLASPEIILGHILRDYATIRKNLPVVQSDNFIQAGQFLAFNLWLSLFAAYGLTRICSDPNHPLWVCLIWTLLSFGWLMVQVAIRPVDLTILLPPLAMMAGWGAAQFSRRLSAIFGIIWLQPPSNSSQRGENQTASPPLGPVLSKVEGGIEGGLFADRLTNWGIPASTRQWLLSGLAALFLGLYGWSSWQQINSFNLKGFDTPDDLSQLEQWPEIIGFIQQHTAPEDCVIIDDPALASAANRLPAPWLVQLSSERIESGLITQAQIIALAQENNCKAVIFSKRAYTRPLSEFREWAETAYPNRQEFTRTRIYYQ